MNGSCFINASKEMYCHKDRGIYACVEPYLPELQAVLLLFVAILSCLLNGFLILAAVRTKSTYKNVRLLTVTLSVAFGFVAGFVLSIRSVSVFYSQLILPQTLCSLQPIVVLFTFTLAHVSLTFISVDRCIAINFPLKYPMLVNNLKPAILLLIMCLLSLTVSIVPILSKQEICFRPKAMPLCSFKLKRNQPGTLVVILTIILVPIIIIFISYLKISLLAKRQKRLIEIQMQVVSIANTQNRRGAEYNDVESDSKHKEKKHSRILRHNIHGLVTGRCRVLLKELRTQKIVLLNTGAMIVCWSPYISTLFIFHFCIDTDINYTSEFITKLLAFFSCWINPLLMLMLNLHYRKFIIKLFRLNKKGGGAQ